MNRKYTTLVNERKIKLSFNPKICLGCKKILIYYKEFILGKSDHIPNSCVCRCTTVSNKSSGDKK